MIDGSAHRKTPDLVSKQEAEAEIYWQQALSDGILSPLSRAVLIGARPDT